MFDPGDQPARRPSLDRPVGPVTRPVARFGLSLEPVDGGKPPTRTGPAARWVALLAASATAAALYVWDDLLLAAPVVAVASVWGPLLAWVLFSALYSGTSLVVTLIVVGGYERLTSSDPSRIARWLSHHSDGRRGRWGRRLITGGETIGFVLASFLLGGIVTTWMVRVIRPDRPMLRTAVASCAIFGVTFAAQYAGIASLVL